MMAEANASLTSRLAAALPGFGNMSWALADQCVVSGATFASTVLAARMLESADFGRFVLCMTAVLLVQLVQNALITAPMLNLASKQPEEKRARYAGSVMLQQALFTLVTTGGVWAILLVSDRIWPEWQLAGAATATAGVVLFGQMADFLRRFYFAFGKASAAFALDVVRYGGQVVLLGAMLLTPQQSLDAVLGVMALSAGAGVLACYRLVGRLEFCSQSLGEVAQRHWRFSRWLLGSFSLEWLQENFLVLAVGASVGLAEVGAYRAAQQLVNVTNIPLLAFSHVLPTQSAAAFASGGTSALEAFVRNTGLRYLLPFALIVVVIGCFGEATLTAVYGPHFAGHGYIVTAFAGILLIQIARELVTVMNRAMENTHPEFYGQLAGCALVLTTGTGLVTAYGIGGALVCAGLYGLTVLAVLATSYLRHRQRE